MENSNTFSDQRIIQFIDMLLNLLADIIVFDFMSVCPMPVGRSWMKKNEVEIEIN